MGKNWLAPAELALESKITSDIDLAICGAAIWDVLSTIGFDFSIITGRRPWRWPMFLYFTARICMIIQIVSSVVNRVPLNEIPCESIITVQKVANVIATQSANLILMLRARAVWHRELWVTILLGFLFCGSLAVWLATFKYSLAVWNEQMKTCQILAVSPKSLLTVAYSWNLTVDLTILILCSMKLSPSRSTSSLAAIMLRDGIFYFIAVFAVNFTQLVLNSIDLNPVMNIIVLPFTLVVTVIAATTIFRRVFIAYDDFSDSPRKGTSTRISDVVFNRFGLPRIHTTNASSQFMSNDIPLGETGRSVTTMVSVHKAVEINDNASHLHTKIEGQDSLREKGYAL